MLTRSTQPGFSNHFDHRARLKLWALIIAFLALVCLLQKAAGAADAPGDRFRELRLKMVRDCIEKEGIKNPRVLDAMRTIPRHEFVSNAMRPRAYFDSALPIGHKQTISPPFIVAYMTELIDPQPTDRVLEIGTGSGYQAAVLSPLVGEVYSIEIVEPLGRMAGQRLKKLGYKNVTTKVGDGYQGWSEHAPFDKILVTCSPEDVPKPLADQLKEGGKMIIPLGERYQQMFYLLEKKDGKLERKRLIPTLFVPMTGVSEDNRSVKPDPLNPHIVNGGFETGGEDDSRPDGWHYLRECKRITGNAREGDAFLRFENEDPGRLSQVLQGLPVDGRKIGKLRVTLSARFEKLAAGDEPEQKPGIFIHFYDDARLPIGDVKVTTWTGTSREWGSVATSVTVPAKARELVLRVGLNGATGQLDVDELDLKPERK